MSAIKSRYAVQWKGAAPGSNRFEESKHHRDKGKFSSQEGAGAAPKPDGSGSSPADPTSAHAFTKSQLSTVPEQLRGLMTALHAHPDTLKTGTVHTPDVAPQHARQVYEHLRQTAASPVNGLAAVGQAVDLGGGKLGYSSPAGAIVVGPADSSGKHSVKFTTQTGVVKRAMGSQQAKPALPGEPPIATQQGLSQSPAAAPGVVGDSAAPGAMMAQSRMPAAQSANPVPPPVPPPQIAAPPKSQASPEQMASMSALTDKPQPKPAEKRPEPSTPREAADQAKQRLQAATQQWQQEVAGGLTPKGNARWRSYTAALKSIWQQHEQLANDWERKGKAAAKGGGKAVAGGGTGQGGGDPEFSAMEQRLKEHDPHALEKIKEVTQRADSYRDLVKQAHDQIFGKQKPTLFDQGEGNPRSDLGDSAKKRESQGLKSQVPGLKNDSTGLSSMGGGMAGGITDAMYDNLWKKVESGDTSEAGSPSALLQVAKAARKAGGISSPEHFKALAKDFGDVRGKGLKGQDFQNAMRQLVAKHSKATPVPAGALPPDERSAMERHGIDSATGKPRNHGLNRLGNPQWTHARNAFNKGPQKSKAATEAEMRRAAAAGFETLPQEQPKRIEGSDEWKRLVKAKASEWDMKPEDFHDLASDLHKELVEHHGQRKEAYLTARKATGLAPADLEKLENQWFDSGSNHKSIKQLDTIGRELAANYPALGWGRGREDEGNDESNIDYGAKVWDLIKGGYQPPPGKHSAEFMEHVEDYLRSQLKRHGSSAGNGNVATDEDLSAVPFTLRRHALVERYSEWLADRVKASLVL